ncbi:MULTISPECIES: hypothetical protein [unclassified Agrococcus]|uniref:hypothetical protein n=1 Tax=unclassified Agrococcus TaxID=2615065 RepID=UPI00360B8F6F
MAESRIGQLVVLSRVPDPLVRALAAPDRGWLDEGAESQLRVVRKAPSNGLEQAVVHAQVAVAEGDHLYAFAHS